MKEYLIECSPSGRDKTIESVKVSGNTTRVIFNNHIRAKDIFSGHSIPTRPLRVVWAEMETKEIADKIVNTKYLIIACSFRCKATLN